MACTLAIPVRAGCVLQDVDVSAKQVFLFIVRHALTFFCDSGAKFRHWFFCYTCLDNIFWTVAHRAAALVIMKSTRILLDTRTLRHLKIDYAPSASNPFPTTSLLGDSTFGNLVWGRPAAPRPLLVIWSGG